MLLCGESLPSIVRVVGHALAINDLNCTALIRAHLRELAANEIDDPGAANLLLSLYGVADSELCRFNRSRRSVARRLFT